MKKLILMIFLGVFVFLGFGNNSVSASYPTYLGGNSNYVLVDGHMGVAWYLDRSSLVVQKYAPPQYIIAVNVGKVNDADRGNTSISDVKTFRFFYNYDLQRIYIDRTGTDDWVYINPNGSRAETGVALPTGRKAFALAYGISFYR